MGLLYPDPLAHFPVYLMAEIPFLTVISESCSACPAFHVANEHD